MAVRRSQNWFNQQRVDVPHLRSIESAVRNDFDELIGAFNQGPSNSYILRGFEINMVGAVGSSANSLQMIVDDSALFHGASDESGTFFQVASGTPNQTINSTTNEKVTGSFTPGSLNYIGLEFTRAVDNTTSAQVFLWNPTNKTEISKTVPLAETFDYEIVVSSSIWDSNVIPISIVETDGSNNVISVEDRRPMYFRLGTAGSSTPNQFHTFNWSEGRSENFWKSSSSVSPFEGGDKAIRHDKDWKDAVMSRFIETIGGPFWYSENKAGSLLKIKGDLAHTQMTGSGKFVHAESTAGQINWDSDIYLNFIGSRLRYKIEGYASGTDLTLSDNQVAYLNIVRGVEISPNLIFTNGSATVTSVGGVSWTGDILAGDYIKIGSEDDTRYFEVQSIDSASQVTLTEVFDGTSTGSGGAQAKYAYGFYQVVTTPSTDRHVQIDDRKDVPFDEDMYWLFFRADNGGATAKVYIRGSSGGELEQGEERQISDNVTLDILEYIGSPAEADSTPDYLNAVTTGVAEVTTYTFPAASALTPGQSFIMNARLDEEQYYFWANIDGVSVNPNIPGLTGVEVALNSADSNVQVAGKYHAAVDAIGFFNSVDNGDGTITVTNSEVGTTTDALNVNMGVGFSINVDVQGQGTPNYNLFDDENLTKSIKRLDSALGGVQNSLDVDPYDETIDIISGVASNDNELQGPVAASTTVTIPLNSRNSDVQETYVVGDADLNIYLNGSLLTVGDDYTEVGTSGNNSTDVEFNFELKIGDVLKFEKISAIGSGGGSGGGATGQNLGSASDADVFKQNVGSVLQFRRLTAGANINITENAEDVVIASTPGVAPSNVNTITGVDYNITTSDDVILYSNAGADRTATLPDAAAATGNIYYIKKIDSGNTLFIKSISGQTLDGVDIDASPHSISIQYESIIIVSDGSNWFIL